MILKCGRKHKHGEKLQDARGSDSGIAAQGRSHFISEGGTCSLITSLLSITCKRLRVVAVGAVRKRRSETSRRATEMAANVLY